MLIRILAVCSCIAFAVAGRSPNADYIEELIKKFGARYSDNLWEDAQLDVPDLIKKYKYPLEEHSVTTEDGYILEMHRIPHGRDGHNAPGDRPVVFLMHGMLTSSADYVLMGPGQGLAYLLAEEGFDVWMGNARGNYYSRRHVTLNPDAFFNADFWQFSWDEVGNYDLPSMIDYALNYTGKSALHYVGFSQGSTSFFVMASLRPDYNQKIITMHALAPVAYMAHNKNILMKALAPHSREIERFASRLGIGEFFKSSEIFAWIGRELCRDGVISQPICSSIFFIIAGWNPDQHNATMIPVKLGHVPAGSSVRQLAHYGQGVSEKKFRRYDFGLLENLVKYGSVFPPDYDLSKITAPVFLHYSVDDPFAEEEDVLRLNRELPRALMLKVPEAGFSHLDFVWGIDARTLVYDTAISIIKSLRSN